MVVHLYGHPADLPAILAVAKAHGLRVIEDCAQAHGAMLDGRKAGTWGDLAAFSFYPTKNLGGFGDGGMIITNNEELANRVAIYRDHGRDSSGTFVDMGYNSRLDAIQAARSGLANVPAVSAVRMKVGAMVLTRSSSSKRS